MQGSNSEASDRPTEASRDELLGPQWAAKNCLNSQLHIRRTYNHGKFMEPKSKASRRKIDLAPELVHELKKWKLACPKGELDLIFPTEEGTPRTPPICFTDDSSRPSEERNYPG